MRSGYFQHHSQGGQCGYILIALTLAVALILIALSAGLPVLSAELRRQREEELIHRGVQYTRAIKQYYRRFGTYPNTLEQLEDNNHIRCLRKRYKDPMTGDDFRLLHVGDVKLVPRHSSLAASQGGDQAPPPADSGDSPSPCGEQPSGSSQESAAPADAGAQGPVFGGGPIIGVASTSTKKSFHVFDENKDHYNCWQFVYSRILDRGGLFTRPYDGIWIFNQANGPGFLPAAPAPPQSGAPGVTLPGMTSGAVSGQNGSAGNF